MVACAVIAAIASIAVDRVQAREAAAKDPFYAVAVLDFESSDKGLAPLGSQIGGILTTVLSNEDHFITVERQQLDKVLSEQEFSLSGAVKPDTAAKVGQLTGARILVTGSVFTVDNELLMVAKIISTETGRVFSESVRTGVKDSPVDAAESLARKVAAAIRKNANELLAKTESREDFIGRMKESIAGNRLPVVSVRIRERHNSRDVLDPAAQTEITMILQQLGFTIVDPEIAKAKPDVEIVGEAFSEPGTRRGSLYSCRGRVEITARRRTTGTLLAADRQTEVAIDLGEQLAGKAALQAAAATIVRRIVPNLLSE
jgi:hypothetical protein